MATADFSVKVNCQGENRRFTVFYKNTLEEFKKQCRTVFKALQGIDFLVKYYDDEEDLITCEHEDEWVEAKRLTTRKNNLLKVSLVPGQALESSSVGATTSDITNDVKSVLSHIYKETETVTEELVSEAVKLLSSLVVVKRPEEASVSQSSAEAPAEEFVLDASRDTLELRPKQSVHKHASIEQQIQEEQQPMKTAPNPMEQSWTFIEVKDENHDEEMELNQSIPKDSLSIEQELPEISEPVEEIQLPPFEEPKVLEPSKSDSPRFGSPSFEPPKLDCEFIADVTMPDGVRVETKQTVTKTWLLRNSGNVQWPLGTMMCYLSGPLHTVIELQFVHDVPRLNPKETTEVTIQFKTSDKILGKQKGTFCLSDQFGKLFGQKFFFDIEVVEAKPAALKPAVPAPGPIVPIPQPAPVQIPQPVPVHIPQPVPVSQPPSKFASELDVLQSMGFNDTKKNVELLEKHKGDLNLVIETLLR